MEATLTYTRLHYEVEVTQRSGENKPTDLYITHEVLETIPSERDSWSKTYHLDLENGWLPKNISGLRSLISTEEKSKVVLDSDATLVTSKEARGTVISSIVTVTNPHIFATREALRFLHLNPEVLREPSSVSGVRVMFLHRG